VDLFLTLLAKKTKNKTKQINYTPSGKKKKAMLRKATKVHVYL